MKMSYDVKLDEIADEMRDEILCRKNSIIADHSSGFALPVEELADKKQN